MENIEKIKQAWESGQLAPVIGAGMSIESNIPDWNNLLKKLINIILSRKESLDKYEIDNIDKLEELINFLSDKLLDLHPAICCRYLKNIISNPKEFSQCVYSALYDNLITQPEPSSCLLKLTKLSENSKDFMSYNFDNVLEYAFSKKNKPVRIVFRPGLNIPKSAVKIYHPHGYLPYYNDVAFDEHFINNEIVLSEDEYHDQYLNPYNWSNAIQMKFMYDYICLFIGLSVNDPNLRRIMEASRKYHNRNNHFIILRKTGSEYKDTQWHKLQEKVFEGFGISIIWVSSFDEIELVIDKICK